MGPVLAFCYTRWPISKENHPRIALRRFLGERWKLLRRLARCGLPANPGFHAIARLKRNLSDKYRASGRDSAVAHTGPGAIIQDQGIGQDRPRRLPCSQRAGEAVRDEQHQANGPSCSARRWCGAILDGRKTQTRRVVDLDNLHGFLPLHRARRLDLCRRGCAARKHQLHTNRNFAVSAVLRTAPRPQAGRVQLPDALRRECWLMW